MEKKKILYFDMDGVLVNFQDCIDNHLTEWETKHYSKEANNGKFSYDNVPGIFSRMEPMKDSIECITELYNSGKYDMYILTTAPWDNPSAWIDKLKWVQKYYPEIFRKKVIISHHKDLNKGDYLVDDQPIKPTTVGFDGEIISFGKDGRFKTWKELTEYLMNKR